MAESKSRNIIIIIIGEQYANGKEQRLKEKEKEQRFKEEVDWLSYFKSIKGICPWSLRAYMEDKILHVETASKGCEMTWAGAYNVSKFEALLLTYEDDIDVDYLYKITEKIEEKYKELIAFWSHPVEGDNNTPKPCVIVQDREQLTDLRKKIGFENE